MATNYQTGGWYDNPETGTNMRWWPSGWTTGADPGAGSTSISDYSGGGGSVDSILNTATQSYADLFSSIKPYDEVNPFFFDEKLAQTASEAEYAPYYKEMLTDYTQGVETKKARSTTDLQKTLEELSASKEYYTGKERTLLDRAVRSTNEGYAGRNLFFAGAKDRDIKELQSDYDKNYGEQGYYTQNYANQATAAKQTAERNVEDWDLASSMYNRDLEREKTYAVKSGVLQRKQETRDEYEISRRKYYSQYIPGL
jgi:hypothetical protein